MATITVIVPVYKVEAYLARCVDSILAQTYADFDLVLVDDGSPDRCGEMCEEYALREERIIVIHQENGGLSAARNTGIEWALHHSDSKYLSFTDSDDWIHPRFLELLLSAAESNGVSVSACGHTRALGFGQPPFERLDPAPQPTVIDAETFLVSHEWDFNYAWGKLYRKDLFLDVRYPVGKVFEDSFTTYKVLFAAGRLAFVNAGMYDYFKNDAGITRSPWKPRELVIFDAMREQIAFYKENGYHRAAQKEENLYLHHYAFQLHRIRDNQAEYKKNRPLFRKLRRTMMRMILTGHKKYQPENLQYCFESAYPTLTSVVYRVGRWLRQRRRRKTP